MAKNKSNKSEKKAAQQQVINANEVGAIDAILGTTVEEVIDVTTDCTETPVIESANAGARVTQGSNNPMAALDALFAEAGMTTTGGGKQKTDAYQQKTLNAEKRVEGECINKQHEAWSEAYQAQRIAAVKLGKYRTQVLGLPAGCRKFSQGKFRSTTLWEQIKDSLDADVVAQLYAMEAAVEALA